MKIRHYVVPLILIWCLACQAATTQPQQQVAIVESGPDDTIVLADNPRGTLLFRGNELMVVSKVEDPPKVRMEAAAGGALGALSFNTAGNLERLLMVASLDDGFTFQQNPSGGGNDADMLKAVELRWDRSLFHGPIVGSDVPNAGSPFKMTSQDNRYEMILQNHDAQGLLVYYDKVLGKGKVIATPPR